MTDDATRTQPKVFISYSWTDDDHMEWVASLGERLMTDGVDVVLDRWSLEDGHDVNSFMEQMVTDPSIKRVIIISNSQYAAKADARKGGVGTETQIISEEVYSRAVQTKFVPVLRERDGEGNACLPTYLKGRKYIDFSDPDNDADAYDQLLRNIFERPRRRKPGLGKPPSYLFDDAAVVVTAAQKAKRFKDFVTSGRGNLSAAFQDFAEEFLVNFEELRMKYSHEEANSWCERIRANIATATAHRDVFVDAVNTGAAHMPSGQFMPLLLGLLERLLPFRQRPEGGGAFFKCSEDNYKLLCYEIFLYSFAALTKAAKFSDARQLLDHRYVAPRRCGGSDLAGHSYISFNSYADSLEGECAQQGDHRRLSVMADLVHDRAVRKDLRFGDLLQADVLLCLDSHGSGWYPRCTIYAHSGGKLELFLRAVTLQGFAPLGTILKLGSPQELLERIGSKQVQQVWNSRDFTNTDFTFECLNIQELQRCWVSPKV